MSKKRRFRHNKRLKRLAVFAFEALEERALLAVSSIVAGASIKPTSIDVRLVFEADSALSTVPIGVYRSVDGIFDDSDQLLGQLSDIPASLGRQSSLFSIPLSEPFRHNPFSEKLLLVADPNQTLLGDNFSDNVTPLLLEGIDKWWATAGDPQLQTINWVVDVPTSQHYSILAQKIGGWGLKALGSDAASVQVNGVQLAYFGPNNVANLGWIESGINIVTMSGFEIPKKASEYDATFQLSSFGVTVESIDTKLIADHLDSFTQRSFNVRVDGDESSLIGAEEMVDFFAPSLHFSAGERYAIPFDVKTSLLGDFQSRDSGRFIQSGAATDFLDLGSLGVGTWNPIDDSSSARIYASIVEDVEWVFGGGDLKLAINYYFHYPRSNWHEHGGINTHEGDWEGATLFFEWNNNAWEPVKVALAQHVELFGGWLPGDQDDEGEIASWQSIERTGSHFDVYQGLGGHASYFRPHTTQWTQLQPPAVKDEVHSGNGFTFTPAANQVTYLPRLSSPSAPDWLRYPGYWGAQDTGVLGFNLLGESKGDDGPGGPAFYGNGERWLDPWDWSDGFNEVTDFAFSDGSQLPNGKWTIISHGLSSAPYADLTAEGWMRLLAEKLDIESGRNVAFHKIDVANDSLSFVIDKGQLRNSGGNWGNPLVDLSDPNYHHVLAFDWVEVSNIAFSFSSVFGFTKFPPLGTTGDDGYAEASADYLYALAQATGIASKVENVIGYSRGGVVASEFVQRLLVDGDSATSTSNVIYLDAEGGGDDSGLNFYTDDEFYAWQGVETYNYYSSTADLLGGYSIDGAYNFDDGMEYLHINFPSYLIGNKSPANGEYDGLVIRAGKIVTKDTPTSRTGEKSDPFAVDPPASFEIFNGDFEFESTAGWYYHGGDGTGRIEANGSNYFLILDGIDPLRSHNWIFVPPNAQSIEFDYQRILLSFDDLLEIRLGGQLLSTVSMAGIDLTFNQGARIAIPQQLRGGVHRLTFHLKTVDEVLSSRIYIDNVKFGGSPSVPVAHPGGGYEVAEGGFVALNGSQSTGSLVTNSGLVFHWDLDGDGRFGELGNDALRGDEVGMRPVFRPNRSDDGPNVLPISLIVIDDNIESEPFGTTVSLTNEAPYGVISGPSQVSAGQFVLYNAIIEDHSDEDDTNFAPSQWSWSVTGSTQQFSGTGTLISFTPTVREKLDISITVHDNDGGVRTITRVINLNVADSSPAPLDVRIDSAISTPGQTYLYRLDGQAGRKLTLSAYWGYYYTHFASSDGGLYNYGSVRLIGPDGTVLATPVNHLIQTNVSQGFHRVYYSSLNDFVLPTTGTYFVEVSGLSQATGNFWLGINNPNQQFQTLSQSAPTAASFGVRGDIQEWSFTATAGQAVGWTYHGDVPVRGWTISNGTSIVAQGAGGLIVTMAFTPTTSGTYYLRFEDNTSEVTNGVGSIGPFGYVLTPSIAAPLDVRVDGLIDTSKKTYLYRLDGQAGRKLTLSTYWGYYYTHFASSDGGLYNYGSVRLIGPDGTVLATQVNHLIQTNVSQGFQRVYYSSLNDFVLPTTGTYFVEVSGLSQATGNFWLGINNPNQQFQTLSQSAPTAASFGVRGDIQEWSFTATAGQAVGWTYHGDMPIRGWTVSNGTSIVAQGTGGLIVTMAFTPTTSGTYYLRFEDDTSPATNSIGAIGPFSYVITPAISAPLDVRIDSSIDAQKKAFLYRLDGQAGRKLTLSAYWGYYYTHFASSDGGLYNYGSVRLIGPDGTVLATPVNHLIQTNVSQGFHRVYYSSLNEFVLPTTGTYFVEVSGLSQATGNFWLGINNPNQQFQTLSQSAPTAASFGVRGDIQEWSFTATAGQAVGWTYHGDVPVRGWTISNGTSIVAQGAGGLIVTMAFTPTTSGTYYLRFEDDTSPATNNIGAIGPFSYVITPAISAPLDVRIDSSIDAQKKTLLYRLDAEAGRKLTLSTYWGYNYSHFSSNDGGLYNYGSVRLIGPDGTVLATPVNHLIQTNVSQGVHRVYYSSLNDFILPTTGTYFVEVSGLSQATGNFWLGINNPNQQFQPLSQSAPTAASFGVRGDIQEWSFVATAGQAVGWTYQGDVPVRGWTISNGTSIVAQGTGGPIVTMAFTPTTSGTYYLRFEDDSSPVTNNIGAIGPFSYVITPAISAPLDVRIDSSIDAQKKTFLYRLDAEAGRKLTLSAYWGHQNNFTSANDGGLASFGSVRLIGPNGNVLATPAMEATSYPFYNNFGVFYNNYYFSSLNDFILPTTGTYFVEASGLSQATGNFWLGINNPNQQFQPLSQSAPTAAAFGVRGDIQEWSFVATAGQAVGWTYHGDVPVRGWTISNGTSIVAQGTGGPIVTMAFTPNTSDTYYLRFEDDSSPVTNSIGSIGPFGYTLSPADVTRPISRVNALPQSASSHSFQVSVTANDPVGVNGATPSGIASIDIFVATDQGAFQYWTTVAATSPVAQFIGQSNHTYWFYSIARDHMGNTEADVGIPHTYTFVGDFDAPLTAVVQVTVDDQTGLMQVNSASRDNGGSGLTTVEHWVSIDGGPAQLVATLPAGSPAADGFHYKSSVFQGLRDGTSHTYRFFSIGKDSIGNIELPPAESTSDVVLVKTFSVINQLLPVSIDVQRGASQRSFVRYVDITFNTDSQASLQQLIDSGRIRLERFALSASNPSPGTGTQISLATAQLSVIGNRIQVDFGAQGIGGNRNANVGDGFYQFIFDMDGDTNYTDARFGFFRIFGDTNGDGTVNATDIALQRLYFGQSGNNLEGDINGDGFVNSIDLQHVTRESRLNKRLNSDLIPYVND